MIMTPAFAFDLLLKGRVGYVTPPRNDKSLGNRAQRRANHPNTKKRGTTAV